MDKVIKINYFVGVVVIGFILSSSLGAKDNQTKTDLLDKSVRPTDSLNQFRIKPEVKQEASVLESVKIENKNTGENTGDFATVIRVVDGDTIEIEGGEKLRYIGMDTPETVDPRKSVQCFGKEASEKNKELVLGKTVRLEKDVSDRDRYGRLLRYVWVGEIFINLELVKQGFAHSYSYPPDVKYQSQFVLVEKEAREKKLGLWSLCK